MSALLYILSGPVATSIVATALCVFPGNKWKDGKVGCGENTKSTKEEKTSKLESGKDGERKDYKWEDGKWKDNKVER